MKARVVLDLDTDRGGIGIQASWIENGHKYGDLGPVEVLAILEQSRILILSSAELKPPLAIKIVGEETLDGLKKLDA